MTTKIYTIGSNGKTPKQFFKLLKENKIDLLLDIRLNNKSQLSGFAKGGDDFLGYLVNEILKIDYKHDPYFAPTEEILDRYHKDSDWDSYVYSFNKIIKQRNFKEYFDKKYSSFERVCFLCVESTPEQCHRRLVAESIDKEVVHL